jgi:hypothetical protein
MAALELDDVLSIRDAARLLGRSPAGLRAAAGRGSLDARRVGRDWITTREAVIRYRVFVMERRRVRR